MRIMRRRSRARRHVATINPTRKRSRRRRRVAVVRRSKHHSPAMRAKISRAVKAAMRRRRAGGGAVVSRRRSRSRSVARRSGFSMARRSPMRRDRIVVGRLINPRRRRSFRRRNPLGIAGLSNMLSRDVLMVAGGAIAASVGTGYIINRFGGMLPLANTKYGPVLYQLAIPMSAAYFLRKKYRAFAQGLVVGGVVMAITSIFKSGLLGASATSLVQGPMGNFYEVGGMGLAGEIGRRAIRPTGAYISSRNLSSVPNAVNAPAFRSAW